MAVEHVNELHELYFASRHGFLVNSNDGFYQCGKLYGMETKLFVAVKYLNHKERLGGLRPVLTKVAAECHVGWDFVTKIEQELVENDRVLSQFLEYVFNYWHLQDMHKIVACALSNYGCYSGC